MELKLEEYRSRRRNVCSLTKDHSLFGIMSSILSSVPRDGVPGFGKDIAPLVSEDAPVDDISSETESLISSVTCDESSVAEPYTMLSPSDILIYLIMGVFWATVYGIAIHLEFGTVYFIISLLFFIWKNTRTGPKKLNEISAYSVFNPNCEAIDGTLKAEQFEKEIRYGASSVH